MRILWHSASPLLPTGYGGQTALTVPRLVRAGHEVAISAFAGQEGITLDWHGVPVFPKDGVFGRRLLGEYAHFFGGGDEQSVQVITLLDVWTLTCPMMRELRVASWTPVDHLTTPPRVHEFFVQTGARPIAMSRFGEHALADVGLDPLYVPHAIETSVYRPRGRQARAMMGFPEDAFVVGMVAANVGTHPPRKAFPQVFKAFARLRAKHDDAFLYVHTDPRPGEDGLDLFALAERCGVPLEAFACPPPVHLALGTFTPERMAEIYSALDVLANPSYGEGFGIPIVEAQACGVPVIVSDATAMPELVGAGWVVGGQPEYDVSQGAEWLSPSADEIAAALFEAYERDSKSKSVDSERATRFASTYDIDRVFKEHWRPALLALGGPREVLPLNRAMRRAAARSAG